MLFQTTMHVGTYSRTNIVFLIRLSLSADAESQSSSELERLLVLESHFHPRVDFRYLLYFAKRNIPQTVII
jgi:hypothetical protein